MKRFFAFAAVAACILALPALATAKGSPSPKPSASVGTVKAYDADTGELTITTTSGRDVSGLVTDKTKIHCDDDAPVGDNRPHKKGDGPDSKARPSRRGNCSADDLTAGTTVRKARLDLDGEDAEWSKVRLAG